ncbi:MAG: hypothetical protein GQF41_3655 [Candidatus Rifleibacterium amylolyticum]|nr:MAG: hypothetical protein GQF41_3655 [Candidatus Rifleibacterium amylolyticum]
MPKNRHCEDRSDEASSLNMGLPRRAATLHAMMVSHSLNIEKALCNFLNYRRVKSWLIIIVAAYFLIFAGWIYKASGTEDYRGKPIGTDFITFYSASRLLQQNRPGALFSHQAIHKAQIDVASNSKEVFAWHYPPPFMLVVYPLSRLSYYHAYYLWILLTILPFLLLLKTINSHPLTIMIFLAFPGTFQNIIHGQNGFLTAALFGTGLWLADKKPFYAGLCLGSLLYKPHLSILIIPALCAGKNWRALLGVVISTGTWVVSTGLFFGWKAWLDFFNNLPVATAVLKSGSLPLYKMPTPTPGMLLLGVSPANTQIIQILMSIISVALITYIWRYQANTTIKISSLIVATFVASPFGFDYDLVIMAPAIALILSDSCASQKGYLVWALLFWLLPFLAPLISVLTRVPFAQIIFLAYVTINFTATWKSKQERLPVIRVE